MDLTLRNHTAELLTVEWATLDAGRWTSTPRRGTSIRPHMSGSFRAYSSEMGWGVHLRLRLGCTKGNLLLECERPWVGPFRSRSRFDGDVLFLECQTHDRDDPPFPAYCVTLSEREPQASREGA